MTTRRNSWPSADLWRRVQAEEMTDETSCPACQCPAVTHQRDNLVGALFCPNVRNEQDRTRMWAMAAKTRSYAGTSAVLANKYRGTAIAQELNEDVRAERVALEAQVPDFEVIGPWLIPILAKNPMLSVMTAAAEAREARSAYQKREAEAVLARRRAAQTEPKVSFVYPDFAADPTFAERRDAKGRLQRRRARKEASEDAPVLTVKRRYDLDDEN